MEIDIDILRKLCNNRAIKYTAHILARLEERGIFPSDIRRCINTGRIIEQYPDDWPFPSCLIYGKTNSGKILHVVVSEEGEGGRIITAYEPDIVTFEADLKTRRNQK